MSNDDLWETAKSVWNGTWRRNRGTSYYRCRRYMSYERLFVILSLSVTGVLARIGLNCCFLVLGKDLLCFRSRAVYADPHATLSSKRSRRVAFVPMVYSGD